MSAQLPARARATVREYQSKVEVSVQRWRKNVIENAVQAERRDDLGRAEQQLRSLRARSGRSQGREGDR